VHCRWCARSRTGVAVRAVPVVGTLIAAEDAGFEFVPVTVEGPTGEGCGAPADLGTLDLMTP